MKDFVIVALNLNNIIFVVHIIALTYLDFINSSHKAWITLLKADQVLTTIQSEYIDFANVFSLIMGGKHSKYNEINNYVIKLLDSKQSLYELIYS